MFTLRPPLSPLQTSGFSSVYYFLQLDILKCGKALNFENVPISREKGVFADKIRQFYSLKNSIRWKVLLKAGPKLALEQNPNPNFLSRYKNVISKLFSLQNEAGSDFMEIVSISLSNLHCLRTFTPPKGIRNLQAITCIL